MMRFNNLKRLKRMTACMLAFLTLGSTMVINTNAEELLSVSETEALNYETDNAEEFTEAVNEISSIDTMVLTVISDKELTDYYGAEKSIHNGNVYTLYYNNVRTAKSAKKKFENTGYTVNYERSESEITLASEETADTVAVLDELSEATEKTYGTEKEGSAATVDGIQKITKNKVVVAVIDNQIDYNDEYLKNRLVKSTEVTKTDGTKEKQFVIIPEGAFDEEFQKNTHATLIAKTITSQTDENVLIAPFNVADNEGNIKLSSVISAIYEAIDMNVDIINISLNAKGASNLLEKAVNDASDKGIQVVVSAGNNEGDTKDYVPSNIQSAIVVSSIKNGEIASSSNTGNTIDYSADGVISYKTGIVNKKGEDIIEQTEGTSIASAKVSAYIALILSEHAKGFVKPILEKAAIDLGDAGFDKVYGNGYLTKDNILQTLSDKEFLKTVEDSLIKKDLTDIKKDNTEVTLPSSPKNDFLLEKSVDEHNAGPYVEGFSGGVYGWDDPSFSYGFNVDYYSKYHGTDTNGNELNSWNLGSAKGCSVRDKTGTIVKVCRGPSINDDSVNFTNFWNGGDFHACQVGVTYEIGIGSVSVYGYDFNGWTGETVYYSEYSDKYWTVVDAYASERKMYMNWSCNHSGATKEVYYDGNEPSSCGYYECTRCGATWGTWGHNWDSSWSYNDSTHWHYCGWNHNHWKDNVSHTYTYWYSTNTENYYKCTVCGRSYSETRYYTIKYYIRNQQADGTWGNYWYWHSESKTYGSTYHADGYGNDSNGPDNATYQNFCVSGTVDGDKDVYIDAYRRKYTINYYIRNENADGTWNNYWYWYSEEKLYESTYHADGYGNDNDGPDNDTYQNFCVSGTVQGNKDVYINAYRRKYTLYFNYNKPDNASGTINKDVDSKQIRYEDIVGSLPAPTLTGWTFKSWAHELGNPLGISTIYNIARNSTATAQWTANRYTVRYNSNGNSGSTNATGNTSDSSHIYDTPATLTQNGFSKTGYTFDGWNTKADGSGTAYTDKQVIENLSSIDGAVITLYAQWNTDTLPGYHWHTDDDCYTCFLNII